VGALEGFKGFGRAGTAAGLAVAAAAFNLTGRAEDFFFAAFFFAAMERDGTPSTETIRSRAIRVV